MPFAVTRTRALALALGALAVVLVGGRVLHQTGPAAPRGSSSTSLAPSGGPASTAFGPAPGSPTRWRAPAVRRRAPMSAS